MRVYLRLTVLRFAERTLSPNLAREFNRREPSAVISRRSQVMRKTFATLLAVATIAGSLSATPASAQRGLGAALAGGIIGGAIVGGAIAASRPAPVYVAPGYVEELPPPPCRWVRQRYWDGYDWHYRSIQICD
jgi:hypothetical protein